MHQRAMRSACALVRYQRAANAVSRHALHISGQSCSGLVSISARGCSSNSGRHHTVKSEGAIADRHSAVLTAKTPEELEKAYDAYAEHYEKDISSMGGGENVGGRCAAKVLVQHANPQTHPALVDFGCGTGIAGVLLHEAGWRHMVACDLSQKMLDLAKTRGLYVDCHKVLLPNSGLEEESFDIVHAAAMFAPGQAPASSFDEFLRVLKPGGIAVFSVRCHYYDGHEGNEHRKRLEELETVGVWTRIAKTEVPYLPSDGVNAYVFVMKKQ